jgi:nicotinamidase/pyrazinamidase
LKNNDALILVDLQNDFFPGGALGVPGANAIFPLANTIQDHFDIVIATKDWHPKNHGSFANNHPGCHPYEIVELNDLPQVLWPAHCIQETKGSQFHPKLKTKKITKIIHKGTDARLDSYSTFFDNAHQKQTELHQYLQEKEVKDLYIMGLATDYCVQFSVLDAIALGYRTHVILDGCFGINKKPGDIDKAIENMKAAGAIIVDSQATILHKLKS